MVESDAERLLVAASNENVSLTDIFSTPPEETLASDDDEEQTPDCMRKILVLMALAPELKKLKRLERYHYLVSPVKKNTQWT